MYFEWDLYEAEGELLLLLLLWEDEDDRKSHVRINPSSWLVNKVLFE